MLLWLVICVVAGVALASIWYLLVLRANHKKADDVLQWINLALRGEGHVTGLRWVTASRFVVPLRLRSPIFRQASVMVELVRRELPLYWISERMHGKQDALTFKADLDSAPTFNFRVLNHRWCAGTHRRLPRDPASWDFDRTEPLVFATRKWQREVSTLVNALLGSHHQDLLALSFRRRSPHFSATVPLESVMPGVSSEPGVFTLLREIAAEVSAQSR